MPPFTSSEIDALAAPKNDGQVLVWPDRDRLAAIIEQNRALFSTSQATILDRPIADWRGTTPPRILTGHQPSFFHAGVWAKNVAAVDLAGDIGGSAAFFVVDSDVSHGLPFVWPEVDNGYCHLAQASVEPARQVDCFEQLHDFDSSRMKVALEKPRLPGESALPMFLAAACSDPSERASYVSRWVRGIQAIDSACDVSGLEYICVSAVFSMRGDAGAAAFVAHLLLHADQFAAAYNGALADYRARRGIHGADHPIPDLAVDGQRIEIPFWLLSPGRPRQRAFISKPQPDRFVLWSGDRRTRELSERDLRESLAGAFGDLSIRPRALALTLYARLLACDLFIHGVGGAKYDQITNDIIRRFFGIEPPAYACVSATLQLPLPNFDVGDDDRYRALRRLRDLRFNPQRAGDPPAFAEALLRREAAIAESTRLRLHEPANRAARREAFGRIHSANSALLPEGDRLEAALRTRLAELQSKLESNRIARWREWFFPMHSLSRLSELRDAARMSLSHNG